MNKSSFKPAKRVLVFDWAGILVSRVSSLQATAKMQHIAPQAVSFACGGKYIGAGGYYFRHENDNVKIEDDDFGRLRLAEYDKLCGEKRSYHSPKVMSKKYKAIALKIKNAKKGKDDDNE